MNLQKACRNLRKLMDKCVKLNLAEGILLSGGLDTSVIAYEASKYRKVKAVTVDFGNFGSDLPYTEKLASLLGLEHLVVRLNEETLFRALKETVRILKTFDPMEVRNSAPIYAALKSTRDAGLKTVMTGDGGDELFFGYNYLFQKSREELEEYILYLYGHMHFSSAELGEALNVKVKMPFLAERMKRFALNIPSEWKVRGQVGKWILRKAYEGLLPNEFIWRVKSPIESGTGTARLASMLEALITDEEFMRKREVCLAHGVKLRNKEQLYYYEIFSSLNITRPMEGGKVCPDCRSALQADAAYCRVCGAYPV